MRGARLRQSLVDGTCEASPRSITRRSAGLRHQVDDRLQRCRVRLKRRAQAAAHAVASNRRSEPARRRYGQSGCISRARRNEQDEIGASDACSPSPHARNVGSAAQPMAAVHGISTAMQPLSIQRASGLDREPLATLTPAAAKNRAPGPARHACAKAMLTLTFANFGLVRAFHREGKARRQDMPRSRSVAPRAFPIDRM